MKKEDIKTEEPVFDFNVILKNYYKEGYKRGLSSKLKKGEVIANTREFNWEKCEVCGHQLGPKICWKKGIYFMKIYFSCNRRKPKSHNYVHFTNINVAFYNDAPDAPE
jgi:hypothetical protein